MHKLPPGKVMCDIRPNSSPLPGRANLRNLVMNYFQDGDFILGGIFTVHHLCAHQRVDSVYLKAVCLEYIWTFIYAIEEINKNPNILPNVTLGYHVHDSCKSVNKAIRSVLQILSGPRDIVPNYFCDGHGYDHPNFAQLWFYCYKIRQLWKCKKKAHKKGNNQFNLKKKRKALSKEIKISYGATDPIFSNKQMFPSFFRTLPSDQIQFLAVVLLLKHFNWTWVGVIVTDDYASEIQSQEFLKLATQYDICIEFVIYISSDVYRDGKVVIQPKSINIFNRSTSKIVVVNTISISTLHTIEKRLSAHSEKTFILPTGPLSHIELALEKKSFHGSLTFSPIMIEIPHLRQFMDNISLDSHPNDYFLEHLSARYMGCLTSNHVLNSILQHLKRYKLRQCSNTTHLTNLSSYLNFRNLFGTAYHVYKAVYAMAHTLHKMQLYMSSIHRNNTLRHQKHIYKYFLRRVQFEDPAGRREYFQEKGDMASDYGIYNFAFINQTIYWVTQFGLFNTSTLELKPLKAVQEDLKWRSGVVPVSRCSEECPKGYRRAKQPGSHRCCFKCVRCLDGEISNDTDKWSCVKCPEDQWPNNDDRCVPKLVEFLSYKKDPISIVVSIITSLCFVQSSIILSVFIIYRDTAVIKANNQNLSFLLLVSIMLSFLCVHLFIGRPGHATCMARHTLYGITSSVAISSILAKTFMVYSAFRATKPGSSWRKFIGVKLTNGLVFICSFIQVLISLFWLLVSPPFPENNTHLYPDIIIIQCNEGSVLAFALLLGYMGLLAAVSFLVAFLARHLPDSFNEAKYITFSMLVFCSVWVTFIPAYLSATGKSTVLVEIFAIISSTVGILGCIFYPKCYIIFLRPELNVKNVLLRHDR
ncbi:vomeronasal type-2 receptor 26-like [Gastrophryne carolinensis]